MEKKFSNQESSKPNSENNPPPGWSSGGADHIHEGDVTFLGGVELEDEPSEPPIV